MDEFLSFGLGATLALAGVAVLRRWLGFGSQTADHYADATPPFDMRRDLNGRVACDGVIYGPLGRVTSRFHGDFDIEWTGNIGVMRERFTYDTGTVQNREWRLTLGNDGSIRAEADDVVGAGRGTVSGNAVNLRYALRLPEDAGGHVLNVDDWMYLAPGGAIVNRSQFRKFGIKVAELVATMHRIEDERSRAA